MKFSQKLLMILPFLMVVMILIYLQLMNMRSLVYIDLVAEEISFTLSSMDNADTVLELSGNLPADSIILHNFDMSINIKKVTDMGKELKFDGKGIKEIFKTDKDKDSKLLLFKEDKMRLKSMIVPNHFHPRISKEGRIITLKLGDEKNEMHPDDKITGRILIGKTVKLSGGNVTLSKIDLQESDELLIDISRFGPDLVFRSNEPQAIIQLYFPSSEEERAPTLIDDITIKNISFNTTDKSRSRRKENSSIKYGKIDIAANDFFGDKFLIREETLAESDFLYIPEDEVYDLDYIKVTKDGLKVSMIKTNAREIKKGKRKDLTSSILPSTLEFILEEPSKDKIWAVLVFIIVQVATIRKFLKNESK